MSSESATSFSSEPASTGFATERSPYSSSLSRAALVVLALLWGYAVYRLGTLWHSYKDYSYGWFVPLLCAGLFWERWKRRPAAQPMPVSNGPLIVFGGLLLFLGAGCLLFEVIPNWRFAGWMFAGTILGLTFCVLLMLGGRPWVNHFAFPLLFFLIAVPWPSAIEAPLIYKLSHLNAALSTVVSNVLGTPAIRRGVIIETGAGLVGVDEACSGIRSFQATVMMALFLGELARYSFFRRIFFLLSGAALSFGCNVIRTTYLVRTCDLKGKDAVNEYHDQAGFTIMGVTLVGLLLLAWILRPRGEEKAESRKRKAESGETEEIQNSKAEIQSSKEEESEEEEEQEGRRRRRGRRATTLRLMLAGMVVWIVVVEAGIEVWFRGAEQRGTGGGDWTLQMPAQEPDYGEVAINENLRNNLRYDEGRNVHWKEANGRPWQMYYLRWSATQSRYRAVEATGQARVHAPEVCLRGAGMTLAQDFGSQVRQIQGVTVRTRTQRFLDQGRTLHMLACYWDPVPEMLQFEMVERPTTLTCLRAAVHALQTRDRMRNEKRVIKVGVWGMETDQEAEQAFKQLLEKMIVPVKRG